MPIEFQNSDTPVQATEKLDELQSEQSRKIKLLELEEERIQAMAALEQKQRHLWTAIEVKQKSSLQSENRYWYFKQRWG